MEERINLKMYATPKCKALFPRLDKPETYQGQDVGYTIKVIMSDEDTKKFQAFLEKKLEEYKALPQFKGKKWSAEPMLGMGEYQNDVTFKFKKKSSWIDKNGNVHNLRVPVFDSYGKEMNPALTKIGNGSIVRVSFTPVPFNSTRMINGISLRLEAVQVLELKQYNEGVQDAGSYGFETAGGGYKAEEAAPSDDSMMMGTMMPIDGDGTDF